MESLSVRSGRLSLTSKLYYRSCCFILFFVTAAASFNGFYDKFRLLDIDEFGSLQGRIAFEAMINGTANRPFVYRQLLPMTANWVDAHVSPAKHDRFYLRYIHHDIAVGRDPYDSPVLQDRRYTVKYAVMYVMVFFFTLFALYALYFAAKSAGFPPLTAAIAAMSVILFVPFCEINAGFYYDYPEIFFFALSIWMAQKFDWWWLIPVAALAEWNKESFLLFTPTLYPLLRHRMSRNGAIAANGVLFIICGLVYLPIRTHFQHNPGGPIEIHYREQIEWLLHPSYLMAREWNYGALTLGALNPLTLLVGAATLWRGWRLLPPRFQRHAQLSALINLPLFFLFCAYGELRDLSMLYVTLLVLVAANLTAWAKTSMHTEAARIA